MSIFSNKLKELFSIKSVDKRLVAQSLNIDRALLYRYLNDQSFPEDTAFIQHLQNELYLTPYEYKELCDAYEITKLGETVYQNRKIVAKILDRLFSQTRPAEATSPSAFDLDGRSIIPLTDRDTIYSALHRIIMDPRTTDIWINLQPDRDFVYGSLFQLLKEKICTQKTNIRHILRFQSKTTSHIGSYNLQIFSQLLPLLYYCIYYTDSSYYANYYYNNQAAVDERAMDIFPNILITPWCTITMSFHYGNGILYIDQGVSAIYQKNFKEIEKNTFPFVLSDQQSLNLTEQCRKNPYREYVFKPHPSASLGLGMEFYSSQSMHYDKDTISLSTTFQEYHQAKEDILYAPTHVARKDFFTASGLKKFLETGQLYTFFSDYTTPLEKDEIIQFLKRYVAIIEAHPHFSCHLIYDDVPNRCNGNFAVFVLNDNTLVVENSRRKLRNISSIIEVTEKSIVDAFCDYLNTGIVSSGSTASREETLDVLKGKIREMEMENSGNFL